MGTDGNVRIVIAEDHELFRKGLNLILQRDESLKIVGEAATVLHAIDVINKLKPDVVLLNTTLPETGGIEVIPPIRRETPKTKAIMLAAAMNETTIFKALKAGAKGYLSTNASVSNLIKAIKAVQEGDVWVERKLMARFFEGEAILHSQREERGGMRNRKLTPREQEVLRYLTYGQTNRACSILKVPMNTICYKGLESNLPPKYCVSGGQFQKSSMIWKKLPPKI